MGVIGAWVSGITGLVIVYFGYVVFMPMLEYFVQVTINLGAPAGNALFLVHCAIWGFIIFGIICIAYPFVYSYVQTYDQGRRR